VKLWTWRLGLLGLTLVWLVVAMVMMVGHLLAGWPVVVGQVALLAAQLPLIGNLFLTDPWVGLWRQAFKLWRRK
jgi:hypothetical protein